MRPLYIYTSTLRDMLRPTRAAAWVLIAVVIAILAKLISNNMSIRDPSYQYGELSSNIVFHFLALVAAIYATAVVNQETEQKTIIYLLSRPLPRYELILCRLAAAITATFVLSAFTAILVSIAVPGVGPTNAVVQRDILALLLGALGYTTLFTAVSLLINKAMTVCLLFAFGWELAAPNMPGAVNLLSINTYMGAVARHIKTESVVNDQIQQLIQATKTSVSPAMAAVALLGLTVFCLAFSAYWFTTNEYVPREDVA